MPGVRQRPSPARRPRLRVLRQVVRDRANAVPALFLALLATGSTLAVPMVVRSIVGGFSAHRAVTGPVLLMTALALGGAVAGALSAFFLARAGERTVLTVRERIAAHALRLPLAEARRAGSGELVARVTSDSSQLRSVVDIGVTQLPMACLTATATLVIMGFLDWVLLLIVLVTFSVAALAIAVFIRGIRTSTAAQQKALGDLAQRFTAALAALPTIKAHRAERQVSDRIAGCARTAASAAVTAARRQAFVTPIMGLGQQFALVGVVLGSGARLASGALGIAGFAAFLLYLLQLVAPLTLVASGIARLQLGLAAESRIEDMLGVAPEGGQDTSKRPGTTAAPAGTGGGPRHPDASVEFDRVTFGHEPGRPTIRGLSFTAPRRGVTALVGPSGAGKTTALGLIEGFLTQASGTIRVLGRDTADWPLHGLRGQVAYLDQTFALLEGTVRENLLLGHDTPPGDDALHEALESVGLTAAVGALPQGVDTLLGRATELSGGQRQRLALARTLLTGAPVILLDEPSSQLDSINENRLREVVERLARERAVIMVAHRISTIRGADHIVVLDEGRLVDAGTHDELLARCREYAELVRGQSLGAAA